MQPENPSQATLPSSLTLYGEPLQPSAVRDMVSQPSRVFAVSTKMVSCVPIPAHNGSRVAEEQLWTHDAPSPVPNSLRVSLP